MPTMSCLFGAAEPALLEALSDDPMCGDRLHRLDRCEGLVLAPPGLLASARLQYALTEEVQMGLVDFVKDAGRKVGMFGGRKAAEAEAAKEEARVAAERAKTATDHAANLSRVASDIKAAILSNVPITALDVRFDGQSVTLSGQAGRQEDREKAVLIAGNTEGVARVDDRLTVEAPAPEAVFHTVATGDTLSEIAGRYYGVIGLYDAILEANRPMLASADRIYPGQVLRIPPVRTPEHVVRKGETLGAIAERWYGESKRFTEIASANRLADPNQLEVGQRLIIPLIAPKVPALA